MDLGLMAEGVVELDPMTGRMVLRVPQEDGSNQFLDVQAELERHKGKEVRLICTPMESVAALADMLRSVPPG
jgi:hypothetical protein